MICIDIETDGLKPSVIWCVGVKIEDTATYIIRDRQEFVDFLGKVEGHTIYAHNGLRFDYPVLEKLWNIDFSKHTLRDTLVLSKLHQVRRPDGHSLKAWGQRFRLYKGDHSDWSKYSKEMADYCAQDVEVLHRMVRFFEREIKGWSEESIKLEHDIIPIIQRQIDYGWLLDQEYAWGLLGTLKEALNEAQDIVREVFKPIAVPVREIAPKYNKDGTKSVVGLKFLGDNWDTVDARFTRIEFEELNLGSRQQVGKRLMRLGWVPESFTEKTEEPKIDDDILMEIEGIPEAEHIQKYMMLSKRIAAVQSWLDAVGDDGRVHGDIDTLGTATHRMSHKNPNMAQVPSGDSPYGPECRRCWIAKKGFKIVGTDASSAQLRMLAHYMKDQSYIDTVCTGNQEEGTDIHSVNQRAAGLPTRPNAKTFIYAYLFGAGDAKIGKIIGGTAGAGRKIKAAFLKGLPALKALKDRLDNFSTHVPGLDGRRVAITSNHVKLNYLLMSAEAILMKKALTILDEYAIIWGIEYEFVGNIHDELQAEVREDQADKFGYLAVESIKAAAVQLNMRCPMDGEYKVGDNWAETH